MGIAVIICVTLVIICSMYKEVIYKDLCKHEWEIEDKYVDPWGVCKYTLRCKKCGKLKKKKI